MDIDTLKSELHKISKWADAERIAALDKANLDASTYNLLYDLTAYLQGAIDQSNQLFVRYLSEK